jgi:hypothetical protein
MTLDLTEINTKIDYLKTGEAFLAEAKQRIIAGETTGDPIADWAFVNAPGDYRGIYGKAQKLKSYLEAHSNQPVIFYEMWKGGDYARFECIDLDRGESSTFPNFKTYFNLWFGYLAPEGLKADRHPFLQIPNPLPEESKELESELERIELRRDKNKAKRERIYDHLEWMFGKTEIKEQHLVLYVATAGEIVHFSTNQDAYPRLLKEYFSGNNLSGFLDARVFESLEFKEGIYQATGLGIARRGTGDVLCGKEDDKLIEMIIAAGEDVVLEQIKRISGQRDVFELEKPAPDPKLESAILKQINKTYRLGTI